MSAQAESLSSDGDDELVARLGMGDETALRVLYIRYAALVFTVAARITGSAAGEEVVQDVFMTLWRKHDTFDPKRGALKSWLCQLARHAALNVRRRQGREASNSDVADASEVADDSLEPDDALWMAHRQSVLRAAVNALPEREREALSLAYFDDLTHEQVSAALRIPLGTTKSRIRNAIQRLAPAIAVVAGATLLVFLWRRAEREASREERALVLVTSSDVAPLRLEAAPGTPSDAHANYRTRPGGALVVLTVSHLPPLEPGEHYVGWVRHDVTWVSLGELSMRSDGGALHVAEDEALRAKADEVQITKEREVGATPRGTVVVAWPAPPRAPL
jgi:RNA polymerase sigma-70 factor (ECF subfamily)